MDINATSFWRHVNGLIKARKTRQEDVARDCGISYQTFRGWVSRKNFPGADDAYRIAQALGATVEHLVFGNDCDESEQAATELVCDLQVGLRDRFAERAMASLIPCMDKTINKLGIKIPEGITPQTLVANAAYLYADAMIAARRSA